MDPSDGNSAGVNRHSSTRRSVAMSDGTTDDEYDFHHMAVSDGFRPSDNSSGPSQPPVPPVESSASASQPLATFQNVQLNGENGPKPTPELGRRPSSISKAHRPHDSLTLRNDGVGSRSNAEPRILQPVPQETATGSSNIVRVESPFQGPSGPSHPYNMYPQRTLSNASFSTEATSTPMSQLYDGATGPTHPYALYTQHTTPVHETGSQQQIPLGFNALPGGYQRQLGPDGEDAGGLIGPLGHTEELPPYTRYPTEAYGGKGLVQQNVTPATSTTTTNTTENTLVGAGGIGMATRNPEFSATEEDLARPQSFPSVRSTPSQASQHEINTAAQDIAEKPTLNKWQRRARKKLFGIIPYWAICLMVVFLVVMASVMAGVLTKFLDTAEEISDGSKDEYNDPPEPVEPERLTSVPPDLLPLVLGSFNLLPLDQGLDRQDCFNNVTEETAWSCDIPFRTFTVDVSKIPNASETESYQMCLSPVDAPTPKYVYGTSPPSVPQPQKMILVNDTWEPGRGPAWWLKLNFNKTVLVAEDEFPTSQQTKRGDAYSNIPDDGLGGSIFKQKSKIAMDGDRPWICTWPETSLEIFIFPTQNISLSTTSTTAPDLASATASSAPIETPSSSPDRPYKAYPRTIKFLERRHANEIEPMPHCRQILITDNGYGDRPVLDDNGNPRVVDIIERDRAKLLEAGGSEEKRSDTVLVLGKGWIGITVAHRGIQHFDLTAQPSSCGFGLRFL
ncbi:hypothetical protein HJFPF1_09138 [Paramyrothecium foliicola]|nr:hypothetical protein HJFPF1_09138 [Paramyrothecium foliicola]